MNMNIRKNRLVVGAFSLLFMIFGASLSLNAQTAEEIEAAKQMARMQGYSDAQIEAMLQKQRGGGSSSTVSQPNATVDRNAPQTNIYGVAGQPEIVIQDETSSKPSEGTPFGHSIFKNANLNFVPSYNIPTPENYKLSAGDEIVIDVWGAVVTNISTQVSPEGSIYIPDLGPVYIYGQTVAQAEKSVKNYLSKIYSGINEPTPDTFVKLSLGKIKSVTVNVIGDVEKPGSYTLPSLSSVASALYLAGGPNGLGTIRDIKLYRNNNLVATFDVYDYVIYGKSGNNVRLEDNDIIIVSPYSGIVGVSGEVKRPMKYEIKDGETLSDLFAYSGGFTSRAYVESVQVDRFKFDKVETGAVAKTYSVEAKDFGSFKLIDGDRVTVRGNNDRFTNKVKIAGAVWRPGTYSISDTLSTLKQLLSSAGGVMDNAYLEKGYIVRLGQNRMKEQVSFSLNNVILGSEKITLMPDDSVQIFYIDSLLPKQVVSVQGQVNSPDEFEYRRGMTIGDAILMAGGITNAATLERVEIARRIVASDEPVSAADLSDTIAVVLRYNLLKNPKDVDVKLEPFDMLFVRMSAMYKPQQSITVEGEVNYPGTYVIEKNTVRLSDVLKRAEGFNKDAYPKGAKLTRVLTTEEFERLKVAMMIARKQAADSSSIDSLEIGDRFSIVIDLEEALENPGSYADVVLRSNDIITIPKLNNTVNISGGVLYPNVISYNPKLHYKKYISNAGGYRSGAIKRKVYMVHMNGSVATRGTKEFRVRPGTEIVVPVKDKKQNSQSVATIMSVAASTANLAAMMVTIINAFK